MKEAEQRKAAKEFAAYWKDKGDEKGESQKFWLSLLRNVFGVEHPEEYIAFEDRVFLGHTSFIDGYIAETKVLIEQKALGKDLTKPIKQSDGTLLTPFQQAKRYITELPVSKHPRWVVTCNFEKFLVYDMERPGGDPEEIFLKDLEKEYYRLEFLVDSYNSNLKREMDVSIEAGKIVGLLYDAILKQYRNPESKESLHSLNVLCVRLVFCLYAEDAGIFGRKGMFHDYLERYDARDFRRALKDLFEVLDTKIEDRDLYLDEALAAFPYVNGGLFADNRVEIPFFTDEIRNLILNKASENFNWSEISPTIFGAVFESTLNPETRRAGGMHYTSIENIHKVIDPLFLNDLRDEYEQIKEIKVVKTQREKLEAFQKKLAALTWLDPACGSGNFLTETFISIRRLENKVIYSLQSLEKGQTAGQIVLGVAVNPIQVSIGQFYGIEINDFAVTVAKTAMWIAESQMMKQTEDIIHMSLDFLPLKSYVNIVEGNALHIDWNDVVSKYELNYIMGNPPFVGSSIKSKADQQKEDKKIVFGESKAGKLDYVACWYKKAADYIKNTTIKAAFVSTNSISQGEQVRPLWEDLLSNGIYINFAYRTFIWDSEASLKAHVHCVIIGFSRSDEKEKFIFEGGRKKVVPHINGYLVGAQDFYINSRGKAPEYLPKLTQGNKPWDDGGLILSAEEREYFVTKYPQLKKYIKRYVGSRDFINNVERYCFWFAGADPNDYRNVPELRDRLQTVVDIRKKSPTVAVQKQADTPTLFSQIRQPQSDYILIPETSSSARRYIPMGFMSKDVIASNSVMVAENASLYMFGVLESNVHMSWVRTLCGRMKSDYRYSPALYNDFPWPNATEEQKQLIEKTAQGILDARALYSACTLADLYDELAMPSELRRAHQLNDKAVMAAYGWKSGHEAFQSEAGCVAELMKMHQKIVKERV